MPPPGFEMLSGDVELFSLTGFGPFLRPLPLGPGERVLRGPTDPGMLVASRAFGAVPRTATRGGLPFFPAPEIPFGLIALAIMPSSLTGSSAVYRWTRDSRPCS